MFRNNQFVRITTKQNKIKEPNNVVWEWVEEPEYHVLEDGTISNIVIGTKKTYKQVEHSYQDDINDARYDTMTIDDYLNDGIMPDLDNSPSYCDTSYWKDKDKTDLVPEMLRGNLIKDIEENAKREKQTKKDMTNDSQRSNSNDTNDNKGIKGEQNEWEKDEKDTTKK